MINITSRGGADEFFDGIMNDAMKDVENEMAADIAEDARSKGMTSVDSYELDLQTSEPGVTINEARVREIANGLLKAD